jgi:hypothetical protein
MKTQFSGEFLQSYRDENRPEDQAVIFETQRALLMQIRERLAGQLTADEDQALERADAHLCFWRNIQDEIRGAE